MEKKVHIEVDYSDWKKFKKYSRLQGSNTKDEICKFIKIYNEYSERHRTDFNNKVFNVLNKNVAN